MRSLPAIFRYVTSGLMVIFAWLQLNDPDPVLWCLLYLVPAGALLITRLYPTRLYTFLTWGYVSLAVALALPALRQLLESVSVFGHQLFAPNDNPNMWPGEGFREAVGILIAAGFLAGSRWLWRRQSRR